MKILFVTDQFYHSNNGMTVSARRFAAVLKDHGHEVRVVSTGTPKDVPEGETAYLMDEIHVPFFNDLIKSQGMVFAKSDTKLLNEAVEWADLVHFLMPFPISKHTLEICIKTGTPYTAAFHVQPENISYSIKMGKSRLVNNAIYAWMNNYFYKYVEHVHCPSRFIAKELMKHGYHNKLHVISNGIDPAFVYEKHEKCPELRDKFVILSVGRYSEEKRQQVLIKAVGYSKYADRIQLILAGKGPNEKKLYELSKSLKNKPVMKFFSKEELLEVMAESDLYVHCAVAEIEAMACMEAFARGLVPVIADSKKSATPQFALSKKCLFRPDDPENLAKHIDYFIEHEDERKALEKKYSKFACKFALEKCVTMAEDMFRAAAERKMINS